MPTLKILNSQDYIAARLEAVQNNNPASTPAAVKTSVFTALGLNGKTDAEIASLPTYDWQKEAFRNGSADNYELSVNGGNEKTKFFLAATA